MESAALTDFDAWYTLAEKGVETTQASYSADSASVPWETQTNIRVLYKLKNGKSTVRCYQVKTEAYREAMEQITQNAEARKAVYPVNYVTENDIQSITVDDYTDFRNEGQYELDLTRQEKTELLGLLREEGNAVSSGELDNTFVLGGLEMHNADWVDTPEKMVYNTEIRIYPQYKKTIAFLRDHGAVLRENAPDEEDLKNIRYLTVWYTPDPGMVEEYSEVKLTDPEDIREFFACTHADSWTNEQEYSLTASIGYGISPERSGSFVITDRERFDALAERTGMGIPADSAPILTAD